ncbi:MAG: FlgD immunoglobulin-like domain containing protein, partial [candidate division WOR-3 bacterium]
VLLVDGEGQISPYPSLPAQRRAYGTMTRMDDYTYEARLDSAYTELSYGVSWIRRVHYDPELDILEINDSVTTTDGNEHELAFNWVTEPEILGDDWIQLPAGYLMLINSENSFTTEEVKVQPSSEEEAFNTLLVSSEGQSINISWFIGKDEEQLLGYIEEGGYHPFNFYLYPNEPEPFNRATTIRYFVAGEGNIRIAIFDLLGREVTVVFDGNVRTGTGEVDWDGTNANGVKVPGGTYICRMTGENGASASEKIIFIK